MKFSWPTVIFFIIALPGFSQSKVDTTGSTNEQSFVSWAKTHAVALQNSDSANGITDLLPVKKMIGSARVVALGEPAHGYHEPLAFRNRLFRYLVEQCGFTAIVLEAGMAESRSANEYIFGGVGTARAAAKKLTIGDPAPETIALLEWMRVYNADPAHQPKLQFYGMDIQLIGFPGDTAASHSALDEVQHYLDAVDTAEAKNMATAFAPFLPRLSVKNYPLLSEIDHSRLTMLIDDLIALLARQRIAYLKTSSVERYEWALHCAVVAQQVDRLVRITPADQPGKIPPDAWKAVNARDEAMTENVKWILHQNSNNKVLVFAHNAHVKNEETIGSVWDAFSRPPNLMGQYLRSMLGKALFMIGSSIEPMTATAEPNSLDNALIKVGIPRFLLDLGPAAANQPVSSWLMMQRPMQANKYNFFRVHTSSAFDAILFMDKGK